MYKNYRKVSYVQISTIMVCGSIPQYNWCILFMQLCRTSIFNMAKFSFTIGKRILNLFNASKEHCVWKNKVMLGLAIWQQEHILWTNACEEALDSVYRLLLSRLKRFLIQMYNHYTYKYCNIFMLYVHSADCIHHERSLFLFHFKAIVDSYWVYLSLILSCSFFSKVV